MKKQVSYLFVLCAIILSAACSKDEPKQKEPAINHVGEKWNVSSVEYNMINQSLTNPGQAVKQGTATNAGAFYFDGGKGSFDITIDGVHKEDVFGYTESTTEINITSISQAVSGAAVSQNVIVLSGDRNTTTMTVDGTVTKQSMSGQFVLTATFTLVKQ